MCGIAGYISLSNEELKIHPKALSVLGDLIAHRGPDGSGEWVDSSNNVAFSHRRLAIIDVSPDAAQPMTSPSGFTLTYNGEIYNYRELRSTLISEGYRFRSKSDTEVLLHLYECHGLDLFQFLRGMFAFALWDPHQRRAVLARDRFGIKPLYFTIQDEVLYFASEQKALLPFLPRISTDATALTEYLTFQFTISENTMFEGISQLMPGHFLTIQNGQVKTVRYWDVSYEVDFSLTSQSVEEKLRTLLSETVNLHLRSDVEVGSYISGGVDSTLIAALAKSNTSFGSKSFHGCFRDHPGYDESRFANGAAVALGLDFKEFEITASDFENQIRAVIYHLDQPTAGPGAFPQFMVAQLAAQYVKVVLGGQGGDEIFGGYARYLIAYLEQCIKAAIDGTYRNGNYVVTIESIIPNLGVLQEYKPLIQEFWREGLFGPLDERYFHLVDRSTDLGTEIAWDQLETGRVKETFYKIFNNSANVRKEAYFDRMTHFDFKTLLPALLTVEDRMSMAHGLESRVPFLDHKLVEFVAAVSADLKFSGGRLKHLLRTSFRDVLPELILQRRDKMGFPVPLNEWFSSALAPFGSQVFSNMRSSKRQFINSDRLPDNFGDVARFSRKHWALMSLELWHQEFHDRASSFRNCLR